MSLQNRKTGNPNHVLKVPLIVSCHQLFDFVGSPWFQLKQSWRKYVVIIRSISGLVGLVLDFGN